MALNIQRVVSDGISVAASRNGAVLAGLFFLAESLGLLLFLAAGTMYVPVDLGSGLDPGSNVAVGGELPEVASSIAIILTSLFMSLVTIPISIIAIRTFVGGKTDRIPDAYLFDRIGRATLSGIVASFVYSFFLFAIPFVAALVFILSVVGLGGAGIVPDRLAGIVFILGAIVLLVATIALAVTVWLHFLFLLHEISIRHRGVVGAFKGSWDTVRGNRLKLGALAVVLVVIRFSAGWFGVPPADGNWSMFQLVATPTSLVLSAVVGTFVAAVFARTYRELRPDVSDDFL